VIEEDAMTLAIQGDTTLFVEGLDRCVTVNELMKDVQYCTFLCCITFYDAMSRSCNRPGINYIQVTVAAGNLHTIGG